MAGKAFDYAVIGGGLVGSSIAYGLSASGAQVAVVDEGDRTFRASRGNFGLVWVQGKGWDFPAYAQWTRQASSLWPVFADTLMESTGIDVALEQTGGLELCLEDEELAGLEQKMRMLTAHTDGKFQFEVLSHNQTRTLVPEISNRVVGACFCPHDGHVNPLLLLRALHQGMTQHGADYLPNRQVVDIRFDHGEFRISSNIDVITAGSVVLCAGLQNNRLGQMVGIDIPVKADRGQLLITEKVRPFLKYPTLHVRQTSEGGLQIGDSSEDAGLDDSTSDQVIAMLAARATTLFPMLENINIVRAWAALRVMTPDGKPVYQASETCPGAFGVACHSGVTLAAAHAGPVVEWITGKYADPLLTAFDSRRFHV